VTQGFADQIGADGFAEDAARAVRKAKVLLGLS
jgi:methanogenic corrinoid protein MtbC1